ncbi:hydrolase [Leptospira perolatii]|uniref:Hydrolase n=1 Tax=Leptospira perolatii TaxID=2023191 RepID=A0A2M9ZR39_9LEPT|nr:HAD family hydrolase [Leptospira perolatii]PJZ71016.1 hydrolase [Leptospira perolatii]PJZ74548.1 hydrolase [Leptospira perolatii]
MALLLDFDNTLFDSIKIYEDSLRKMEKEAPKYGFRSVKEFQKLYQDSRAEVKSELKGVPTNRLRLLYFKKMVEKSSGSCNPKKILDLDQAYFRFFLNGIKEWKSQNALSFQKIIQILKEIQNHETIVLLTNENLRTQLLKASVLLPKELGYHLVTSEEIGAEKPSSLMFQRAFSLASSDPENSYMIGDSLEDDIKGALNAGIREVIHIKSIFAKKKTKELSLDRKETAGKNYWEAPCLEAALNYILGMEAGKIV